ncbi:MAG: VWA domain-containing protein [Candidatus Schekmanbacteria bacterium]|nr:VWA domain-containing protein [Candidatus Schekmanbacteria bacterium]
MPRRATCLASALLVSVAILACGGRDDAGAPASSGTSRDAASATARPLRVLSGSENTALQPIVERFAAKSGVTIEMTYKGSVDIALELEKGKTMEADSVWPANSLWIELGDRTKVVKHAASVARSPVVLAIRKSLCEELGWVGKPVVIADILAAADAGKLNFAMTSATQSNSGAAAYLGFLHALAGSPDVLTHQHLQDPLLHDAVRRLLSHVERSSGSSGWLKDLIVSGYDQYDAMFNYESLVIEANRELVQAGKEPLCAVYPADGLMVADHPLGYVDHADAAKEQVFLELQRYLSSAEVRREIESLGRRASLLGLGVDNPDPAVFNPEWCIDVNRVIASVPTPPRDVVQEALNLYQTALRKPSLTVYALDYSGSMAGDGERQLEAAMRILLDPEQARRYMIQASPRDVHIVVPFSHVPMAILRKEGNDPAMLAGLLREVLRISPSGGTDIYRATAQALDEINAYADRLAEYFPAIILMTDGKSAETLPVLQEKLDTLPFARDIPVFSIMFGSADSAQLERLSKQAFGKVFDGQKDLIGAFRQAKGFN